MACTLVSIKASAIIERGFDAFTLPCILTGNQPEKRRLRGSLDLHFTGCCNEKLNACWRRGAGSRPFVDFVGGSADKHFEHGAWQWSGKGTNQRSNRWLDSGPWK